MIRLKRVLASQEVGSISSIQFSANDVLRLLMSIEELKSCEISIGLTEENNVEFAIGEYVYSIQAR